MPKLSDFTNKEIADIHYYYGLYNGVANAAHAAYLEVFPNRLAPSKKNIQEIHRKLSEYGIPSNNSTYDLHDEHWNKENEVLEVLYQYPKTTVPELANQNDVSKKEVWRILKMNGLHHNHFKNMDKDELSRCIFSCWMQAESRKRLRFYDNILWTDIAIFTKKGITSYCGKHARRAKKSLTKSSSNSSNQFSVNVWAGLIGDQVVGPVILPPKLSKSDILDLFKNLNMLLCDVPLMTRKYMYLQITSMPPQYLCDLKKILDMEYSNWIGPKGTISWPENSDDLNPMNYFFWDVMRDEVYKTTVNNRDELEKSILQFGSKISQAPDKIRSATEQTFLRTWLCLTNNGKEIEDSDLIL